MLFLVCAHPAEARPLIAEYGLQKMADAGYFPIYQNHERNMALTLTGTGKTAAAAACMHLAQILSASANDPWINVGIAGHGNRTIGEAVIAHKIIDAGSRAVWYPHLIFTVTAPTDTCMTVGKPQSDYPDTLCDMEASGIFATLSRVTTLELVHCLKVVSDNRDHPHTNINKNMASDLIAGALPVIDMLRQNLLSLSTELQQIHRSQSRIPDFLDRWHFTHTQKHMLEVLLKRWDCLKSGADPLRHFQSCHNAKSLLTTMQTELDACDIHFVSDKT